MHPHDLKHLMHLIAQLNTLLDDGQVHQCKQSFSHIPLFCRRICGILAKAPSICYGVAEDATRTKLCLRCAYEHKDTDTGVQSYMHVWTLIHFYAFNCVKLVNIQTKSKPYLYNIC